MKTALIVFTGSGFGGACRYFVQKSFVNAGFINFPAGTFVVNILGCFLIGLFNALAEKNNLLTTEWRLALTTGFCGGSVAGRRGATRLKPTARSSGRSGTEHQPGRRGAGSARRPEPERPDAGGSGGRRGRAR